MGNCKECERLEKVCRDTHNDLVRAMEENNKLREEILELKKLKVKWLEDFCLSK